MQRRKFLHNTIATTIGASVVSAGAFAFPKNSKKGKKHTFNLKYAPHLGMFENLAGKDPVDQLNFMADQGFTAFEDNNMMKRPVEEQEAMAKVMKERGITMGVFVAHKIYWGKPNLTNGDATLREEFLSSIKEAVTVAKRVNAKWITVVPGHVDLGLDAGYQTANVVETLRQAAAILEPHEITMVLEPLNFRDHPGQFLKGSAQAYEICKAVNSPSCKILFDVYHQQITEGNLIPNIEACWDEIGYFQMGDNPGRKEPTTGEINYKNIFKYIHEKGFKGVLGMEHGNSQSGEEGEWAVIEAYKQCDDF
ncbi:hydroxypyruvate isomerase family protein [Galbibacter mesophilus]|uniref:hydroxypyruvate isomerase family protein n=1 Tax=Galbibacter mesophilus TaxID=379069 RepID=UPI00191DBC78|nr:TIM barrel protein [Galbibacter mesophilus]MCM5661840.1 TIM barrel protein [Galbibacter mesophilus]